MSSLKKLRHIVLLFGFILLMQGCRQEPEYIVIDASEDVEGLSLFSFQAELNDELHQDIVFEEQEDHSYQATVVHEVDLSDLIASFDFDGKVVYNGDQISNGKTKADYSDEFAVRFGDAYVIFKVKRYYTIPTLYINSENNVGVTSKEDYVNCEIKMDAKNMYEDFTASLSEGAKIRGRGNSTWKYYDKKPYKIKLDSKASLLDMGKAKKWVLLANYRDPSDMMNAVTFDMARYMGLPYTNSNRFVELYLDDEYVGLYQLTEQVEEGKNRIAIDEDSGVLLSLDLDDGPDYAPDAGDNFESEVFELPVCVKYPEDQTSSQIQNIRSDFAALERLIEDHNYAAVSARLDISSLIDFLIIQEMTRNVELVAPRSMYMYKDADEIYHFGPVWDFDGGFAFNWASMTDGHGYFGSQSWLMGSQNPSEHPRDAYNYISDFFVAMFADATFVAQYQARWNELSSGMFDDCFAKVDDYYLHCADAFKRDAARWPIDVDYTTSIDQLKDWLSVRADDYTDVVADY